MSESKRIALVAAAAAMEMDVRELKRLLSGLNALAAALLVSRARDDPWCRALTVSRLADLGMTTQDCRELADRALVSFDGKLRPASRVVLTDAALPLLQEAIPAGAISPVFDSASRRLKVAGELIVHVAPQGSNLAALLGAIEGAKWARRVEKPLDGLACAGDRNRLARAAHDLNALQRIISFHADGDGATWNWRAWT